MKGKKDFDLKKTFQNSAAPEEKTQEENVAPAQGSTPYDVREGLKKLRKNVPVPYTTMKVKKELHRQLKAVSKRENVNAVELLEHIIEDWLKLYENSK